MDAPLRPSDKPFLRVLAGEPISPPPIWLMRQAGRYLPEYRKLRAESASFLEFCATPKAATEATLQPIRRFGFDAAILFSDILVVPHSLGQRVSFEANSGPKLEPIKSPEDFAKLKEEIDLDGLAPVFETIERVKERLSAQTSLIGFCGAPFTVASYMIAGYGAPDQAPARLLAYRDPALFQRLIDRLVIASIAYLTRQIEAGVEAVQVFDSWAGVLPTPELERWSIAPVEAIIAGVKKKAPGVPIILFPRGVGQRLPAFPAKTGLDGLSLDACVDPAWARQALDENVVLQGNLDPLALLAGGQALEQGTRRILSGFAGRPHIFNLGHGVLPETPTQNVELMLHLIRRGGEGNPNP